MQKKVLLSGYYGWDNIGDDAILKYITEWLKANDISPVVICNNPEIVKERFKVDVIGREDFTGIIKELKAADGYISGGGSLIQDVTSKKSALYYLLILLLANKFTKKTFVYGQGLGPLNDKLLRRLTKHTFSKSTKVAVRDEQSVDFLKHQINLKKEISLMQDPVLLSELKNEENINLSEEEMNVLNKKPIFISLKPNINNEKMKEEIRTVIAEFERQNRTVISIPFHKNQDTEITKEIFDGFSNTYIFERELTIEEVLFILKKSQLVLGMRLHSLIMASSMHTPILPISYDPKIDAFAKIMGVPVLCDIDGFDAKTIVNAIDEVTKRYENEKERVATLVGILKEKNELVNSDILSVIRGH